MLQVLLVCKCENEPIRFESPTKTGVSLFWNILMDFILTSINQSINQAIKQSKWICIAPPTNSGRRRLTIKT